jgi:predicted nucleic acid-binding Zn ribbon protein
MQKTKIKKGVKYCPQCGAELKEEDKFCTKCNYSFEKRKKKIKWKSLIIAIIIILLFWIVIRIITGKNIIPTQILNIFTNKTAG